MTDALLLGGSLLLIALAVWLCERIITRKCSHPRTTRYWAKAHRFIVKCDVCWRTLERGRDPSHRYPDEAPGVRRGRRKNEAAC